MLRRFIFTLITVGLCFSTVNAKAAQPFWTLEGGLGLTTPTDDEWDTYYGSARMPEVNLAFARRFFYVLDLGLSASYSRDRGTGYFPSDNTKDGSVIYESLPIDIFLVFRARFSDNQWVVPYIGGGYTRFFYRANVDDDVDGNSKVQGSTDGTHIRAGIQILLDPFDVDSSRMIYSNFGVINSYLYLEGRKTDVSIESKNSENVELGGISYKVGVMLEY